MKKSGFTLAELLISLGITGVITALMATALLTLQPDQKKAIYLRNYDALTKAVKALAGNSRLFPVCQDNLNCQAHPLFNTATGIDGRFASIGAGDGKLCKGLSYMMNGQMLPQLNCENQPIAYSDGNWTPSFRTYRTEWLVSTLRELNGSSATYQSDVYFDLNGTEGPNCIYSDSCQNPDRFKFLVAADGTVIPADPVGQEYILKRKNWRKSRLSIAEDSITKENLLANLRTFNLTPCQEESSSTQGGGGNGTKEYELLIPCGANLNGKIINCYYRAYRPGYYWDNSTNSYWTNETSFTSNFTKYTYPRLYNPQGYFFHYPVQSNLSLERYAKDTIVGHNGTSLYADGNMLYYSYIFPVVINNIVDNIIIKTTINRGEQTSKIEDKFYYEINRGLPIAYPKSFDDIIKNIYDQNKVLHRELKDLNKKSLSIWIISNDFSSPHNKSYAKAGASIRCTPLEDTTYIYLSSFDAGNKSYLAEDIMEIYYARFGNLSTCSDEYKNLINDILYIDHYKMKELREQIKKDLNEGYIVKLKVKGENNSSPDYLIVKNLDNKLKVFHEYELR